MLTARGAAPSAWPDDGLERSRQMPLLRIDDFSGGLFLAEGREFGIKPEALILLDNFEFLNSSGLIGRRGRTKLNSVALDGGDPIRGLWRHYPRTGTKNTLAMVDVGANVTAYKADDASGTFAAVTTGLVDDALWGFANWPAKNKTFIVSGNRGGTGTGGLREWNGTNVSSVMATQAPNKVTNGDFSAGGSWTYGTGWAYDSANGEADHTSGTAVLQQNINARAGETYILVFTVRNRTAGSVTPSIGGVSGSAVSSNTTATQTITSTGTANLTFTPTTDFDGSIDDVSVRLESSLFSDFGPYITLHKVRLFATRLSELNFSLYASEVSNETVWLSASQLSVNDPQGGLITGLASFFDFLLIFKETSLFRFVGDISTSLGAQLALYSDLGCIAPQSIAISPYGVIFVGRNGVYITDGVNPNPPELSLSIRSLFVARSTETQYPTAIGRWYPNKQQYVLKLDPTASEAYILTRTEILAENLFIGERSRVAWSWSKNTNLPASAMAVWDSEQDDGRLITGDSVGFVHIYDRGTTDDGTAIVATGQTSARPIGLNGRRAGGFRTGRVNRLSALHRAGSTFTAELLYDFATPGGGAPLTVGDATLEQKFPRVWVPDRTLLGRFVSVWFRHSASSADVEIHNFELETQLRSRRVWRDTNDGVGAVLQTEGNVVISGTATEAVVTFATAQSDTNYEIAFGLAPSAGIGPTTVGIKPGTKAATGFTAEVGGAPGVGNSYTISWILSRAS